MAIRKIKLMHRIFGKTDGHCCRECSNLVKICANNRPLSKCKVYGNTNSEASDWAQRWLACGMFNKPYKGPVMDLVRRSEPKAAEPEEPLEGQMMLDV